jgi:hypothetical protein
MNKLINISGNFWIKLWFSFSITTFVMLQLSYVNWFGVILNIIIAFFLAFFLENKYKILNRIFEFKSKKYAIISFFIASYTTAEFVLAFSQSFLLETLKRVFISDNHWAIQVRNIFTETFITFGIYSFMVVIGLGSLFFIFTIVYAAVSRTKLILHFINKIWHDTDKIERIYFISAFSFFSVFLAIFYISSPVFWGDNSLPASGVVGYIYDADIRNVFSSDHQFYFASATAKQLFFQLINFPFAIIARALGRLFFFIPFSYVYFLQLFHIALMILCGLLILRMCTVIKGASKILFLLLYTVSYPFLVFSILLEKYILSTFCIILMMYVCIYAPRVKNIAAIASAGVLTTNIVAFPFITYDKNIKTWLINCKKYCVGFFSCIAFCGTIPVLINLYELIMSELSSYGSGISFANKAMQFINFISSCFIKPITSLNYDGTEAILYEMALPTSINWLGIILATLALLGFIINRKLRFAQFAMLWAFFAFIILFAIGWQSKNNEMFLSTFYFGWAFISLIFLFFEKLLANFQTIKYTLYILAIIIMSIINIAGIVDLMKFGMGINSLFP